MTSSEIFHDELRLVDQILRHARLSSWDIQRSGARRDPHHVMDLSTGRRGLGCFHSDWKPTLDNGLTGPKAVTDLQPHTNFRSMTLEGCKRLTSASSLARLRGSSPGPTIWSPWRNP